MVVFDSGGSFVGLGSWDFGGFMWVFIFPLPDLWCILATCWFLLYLQAVLEIYRCMWWLGMVWGRRVLSLVRITPLDPKL